MSEHKPITDQELQEMFDRCERATPGPWNMTDTGSIRNCIYTLYYPCCAGLNDSIFIAHAREDVTRLVAEVKRLREETERYRRALEQIKSLTLPNFFAIAHKALAGDKECTSV